MPASTYAAARKRRASKAKVKTEKDQLGEAIEMRAGIGTYCKYTVVGHVSGTSNPCCRFPPAPPLSP